MPNTMQCVHFLGESRLEVREVPRPEPKPGEALVRIVTSALCGSELPALRRSGSMDGRHNPGHELVGLVVQANGLTRTHEGQRVGLQVLAGCGQCLYCMQGDPKHCANGTVFLPNGHSEYVAAPEMCMIPLPDDLNWEEAVLLCGDTLGTPYRALKRMGGVCAGQTAAIFGYGPIGMGCLAWLKFYGLRTIVSETIPYRQELARRLGADLVIDPTAEDVVARVRQETEGGADLCLDCSHAEQTLLDAMDAADIYGRVGWIGEKPAVTVRPSAQAIRKELQMTGSWYFTAADFCEELALYRRGLSLCGLITHRYPLVEAEEAYRVFAGGQSGKVVLCYDGR